MFHTVSAFWATLNLGLSCPNLRSPPELQKLLPLYMTLITPGGKQAEVVVVHMQWVTFLLPCPLFYIPLTHHLYGTIRLCWQFGEIAIVNNYMWPLAMVLSESPSSPSHEKFLIGYFSLLVQGSMVHSLASFFCSYLCTTLGQPTWILVKPRGYFSLP